MSNLALNDDGTIVLPLRGAEGKVLILPEPSIAQLAEMTGYIVEADAMIPPVPQMPEGASADAIIAAAASLRERTVKTYSAESPYGSAIVKIVKLLTEVSITLDDLPGWAASPNTCRTILGHWQTPLAGED
jgi:hypothetical protein